MVLIVIKDNTKQELDKMKVHPRETYGDVVDRLIQKNRFDSTTQESIGKDDMVIMPTTTSSG